MLRRCLGMWAMAGSLALGGCGSDGDGGGSGYDPSLPSGELSIEEPTSDPDYTTFQDSVTLSGFRSPTISAVSWTNLTTGASGIGQTLDYPDTCCFLFACWDCLRYLWGAAVSLQGGENQIRVYADGRYADGINVTLAPSLDLSGHVLRDGNAEFNVRLTLASTTDPASSYTTTTDSSGYYRFRYVPVDVYRLQPEDQNYLVTPCATFTPTSLDITSSGVFDFAVSRSLATLSGRVTDAASGYGVYAARLTLADAGNPALAQRLANPYGEYAFTCVPDGDYTLTPSADPFFGYLGFSPASRAVTVSGSGDVPALDFQGYR